MPLYLIKQTLTEGGKNHVAERMVDAPNKARAVAHVAADTIEAESCEPKDIARLTKAGINIEAVADKS